MYKNEYIKNLSDRLERGEISPNQCLKTLNQIRIERQELKERCEAMLTIEYQKEAERRMELYKSKPDWFELRLKLIQSWRDARPLTNNTVIEEIKLLPDTDLKKIDLDKLELLDITNKDIVTVFKSLEDLIL